MEEQRVKHSGSAALSSVRVSRPVQLPKHLLPSRLHHRGGGDGILVLPLLTSRLTLSKSLHYLNINFLHRKWGNCSQVLSQSEVVRESEIITALCNSQVLSDSRHLATLPQCRAKRLPELVLWFQHLPSVGLLWSLKGDDTSEVVTKSKWKNAHTHCFESCLTRSNWEMMPVWVRCCWVHLDWILHWTQVRPLGKGLRVQWRGQRSVCLATCKTSLACKPLI